MNKHVKRMQSAAICAALLWSAGAYPLAEGVKPLLTSITAYAEDGTLANGLHYRINDGAAIIDGYTGSEASIEIPSKIYGYSVTEIGDGAFSDCASLTSVTIPYSVTRIGGSAFSDCTSLTSIHIPDSVFSIGGRAFFGCTSLTSITIPEDVTRIDDYAFKSCTSLTSITIPEGVTYIGWDAFSGCTSLTSITIPEGVTSIDNYAFSDCTSLTSITIPESVTSIGESAFESCTSLTSIHIPEGVTSIGGWAFRGTPWLSQKQTEDPLVIVNGILIDGSTCSGDVVIPEGVTSIGESAFKLCTGLTTIIIPEGVTSIGNSAFSDCTSLTSITIPEGVTSIDNYAFSDCTSLTSIHIPEGVTSIGEYAFSHCTSLTSITIHGNVKSIDNVTFRGCTNLTSITIPDSVTSIEYRAFWGCTSLTSITIPKDVTSIGESAFESCTSLTSITIPESVTSIGACAFKGTAWLSQKQREDPLVIVNGILIDGTASLGNIVVPDDVTSIGDKAFQGCTSITSIYIPDSVISIGLSAFDGCSDLKLITILNSKCIIYDFFDTYSTLSDSAVIMGYQNSTAQKYAEKNNRAFEPMAQGNAVGDEAAGAQIWGCTMTLGEQLTLNYQVHLTAETASDANAYMLFILPDGSIQRVPVADAKINADDLYVFPCSFPARMMNQQIYARLVTSDANSDFHSYSGAKYLETVAADSSNEAAQELAQKTLDYGTYAEAYFDKNAATVPEDNEMRNTTISAKPMRIDGDLPEGIAYYGMSLLLRDQVAVRLYFDVDDSVHASAYGLTHKEGTYYYLDTPVSAENLLNEQTVNIGSASITFSSMSYASLACSSSSDEKLQATMKSLYLYAKAAQEYQEYLDPFPQGSSWKVKAGWSFVVELYPSSEGYMNATEGYVITILGTYNGSSCEVAVTDGHSAVVKCGKIINLSVEDKEFLTRLEE